MLLVASYNYSLLEPWIDPEHARTQALQFDNNLTVKAGALIGVITASGKGALYNPALSNGTEKWLYISRYAFTTDATGNVTLGGAGTVPDLLHPVAGTELVFWRGAFLVSQLSVNAAAIDGTTVTLAATLSNGPAGSRYYGSPIGTGFGPYVYIP